MTHSQTLWVFGLSVIDFIYTYFRIGTITLKEPNTSKKNNKHQSTFVLLLMVLFRFRRVKKEKMEMHKIFFSL